MTNIETNTDKFPRKALFWGMLGIAVVAFFTMHGTMSLDPAVKFKITRSLVDYGDVQMRVTPEDLADPVHYQQAMVQGPDGNSYSGFHGIGQILIFAPPYFLFHEVLGIESDKFLRSLLALTVFPIQLALLGWITFLLLRQFGFSPRPCYLAGILVVFGTCLWETAKECQDAVHIAFCFMLCAYGLRCYQKTAFLKYLILIALAIGYAFITRADVAPTVVCVLLFAMFLIHTHNRQTHRDESFGRKFFPYLLLGMLTLPFLCFDIWHNMFRFGHPIASYHPKDLLPYEVSSFALLIRGLKGFLYSPGKGLFFYNPILLLAIPGLVMLWRSHRRWAVYILTGFAGCVFLHAIWPSFHGNICWGPRYLFGYLSILIIPVMFFAFSSGRLSRVRLSLFGLVAAISIMVQVASVSLHYNRELLELDMAYEGGWSDRLWTMFEPEAHFIERRIANIGTSVTAMATGDIAPWPTERTFAMTDAEHLNVPVLNYLAFWPYHLTYYLPVVKPGWVVPLWGSTLILCGGVFLGLALIGLGWRCCPREAWAVERNAESVSVLNRNRPVRLRPAL